LNQTFIGFGKRQIPDGIKMEKGKVRDIFDLDEELLIVATDRISAFDTVLTTIPYKGQVLNGMSNYWFYKTEDIIPNHIKEKISSRAVLVNKCEVLPIEVVIRGYLTGSAWRDYEESKQVSGIPLSDGMRFNQRFRTPLLTPSTKAEIGNHDEPISTKEIIDRKLVAKDLWEEVENVAFELFERGTEIAANRGLILVDTKYEFGMFNNELVLVDEVHTPDSSRYWYADTYDELFDNGEKQNKIDKEYLRQWLMEKGYMGDGAPPFISDDLRTEVSDKYIKSYELITGAEFDKESNLNEEIDTILSYL
jgi:phosphoribosylaminoimidazole-succinocarboxamide synthase